MKSNTNSLTEGPLAKQILLVSLPLALSNLLQVLFNMSDVAVVGRFAGSTALGAVGSTSIFVTLFTGFLIGLSNGINVLVARFYGARHTDDVRRTVHSALVVSFIAGVVLLFVGLLGSPALLRLLNTKEDLLPGAILYLRVYFLGMPALALYNFGNAIFSAIGDTKKPLKLDQDSYANRLKLCIPVLGVGAFLGIGNALGFINYTVIWRYFSWTNQTLAMIVLWAASMYLFKEKKNYWITAVPATFMSAVSCTYFVLAPECLGGLLNSKTAEGATIYNTAIAYPVGIVFAVAMLALFIHATKKHTEKKAA
jgi:O-antigen/teichoic acid export membrane protein